MDDLHYRDLRPNDFDAMWDISSNWQVVRQLGGRPWPPDPAITKNRCKPYDKDDGFVWAVCLGVKVIGCIGVTGGDLGYMYHPDVRGQGIATTAARRAINHAFARDVGLERLTGSTWHDNPASKRVLRKLGFTHWQTSYHHAKARSVPTLVYWHHLTRDAWDSLRTRA